MRRAIIILIVVSSAGLTGQMAVAQQHTRPLLIPPQLSDRPRPDWPRGQRVDQEPSDEPLRGQAVPSASYLFPGETYSYGPRADCVLPADFNGDGLIDVAVGHDDWPGYLGISVTIQYGRSDGTFGRWEEAPLYLLGQHGPGGGGTQLAAGDFNSDGMPDLVVLHNNGTSDVFTLLLSAPGGGFTIGPSYPSEGSHRIAAGDFNADGISDLCTSRGTIRYGQGDGTLGPAQHPFVGASFPSDTYQAPVVADINGDGIDDAAIGFGGPPPNSSDGCLNRLWISYGAPVVGLGAPTELGTRYYGAQSMVAGDFNADGHCDIAVSGSEEFTPTAGCNRGAWLYVFFQAPDGSFAPQTRLGWPVFPGSLGCQIGLGTALTSADVNGDGRDDLIVNYHWYWSGYDQGYSGRLAVLYGPITTAWEAWQTSWFQGDVGLGRGKAVDLDRDGRPELIGSCVFDYDRRWGRLATRWGTGFNGAPQGIAAADFDGDGKLDLAVGDSQNNCLRILWGNGNTEFTLDPATYAVGGIPFDVAAGDFNGDGLPDIAVSTTSTLVRVFHQTGPRRFGAPSDYSVATSSATMATADFNKDNRLDLAVGNTILYGQADGTLGGAVQVGVGRRIVAADFDHDGWVDLAGLYDVDNRSLGAVFNQAGQGFSAPHGVTVPHDLHAVAAGDFNHDGWLDIAAWEDVSSGTATLDVLLADPGGGFTGPVQRYGPFSFNDFDVLVAADVTRDGYDDLLTGCGGAVALLTGKADGTFADPRYYYSYATPTRLTTADFDRDGRLDVAGAGGGSRIVFVLRNTDPHKAAGDLRAVSITGPTPGFAGQIVDVSWTVQNQRTTALTGKWTDGIYLSQDATWDINDRCLGTLEYNGTLAGGASYPRDASVSLPAVAAGDYYLLIRADMYDDIQEPDGSANNVVATPIHVDVPELAVCLPGQACPGVNDAFAFAHQVKLYKVVTTADQDLRITLDADRTDGVNELYIRYQYPATRVSYDARYAIGYEGNFAPDQTVRIPGTQTGTYYVLAFAEKLPSSGAPAAFNLKAEYLPFTVTSVTPLRGGNIGEVTITLDGSGFRPGIQAVLRPSSGGDIYAVRSALFDFSEFTATFDLDKKTVGVCAISVTNADAQQIVMENAFTIEQGLEMDVSGTILGPTTVRGGVKARYSVYISNNGNTDIPYLLVDISYPSVSYLTGITINIPHLPPPPPIEGVDWASIDPTVTVDGRVHYPILLRDYPPTPSIVIAPNYLTPHNWLGDVAFTIQTAPDAPAHSAFDVTVLLCAMSEDDFVSLVMILYDSVAQHHPRLRGSPCDDDEEWIDCYRRHREELPGWIHDMAKPTSDFLENMMWKTLWPFFKVFNEVADILPEDMEKFIDDYLEPGGKFADGYADILRKKERVWGLVVQPGDPNDKLSPNGWGEAGYVRQDRVTPYTICFENLPAATAAALGVRATDQLHANLDWSTLTLGEIGFAGTVIQVPAGLSHYEGRVELDGWTWDETDGWHRYDAAANPVVPLVVDIDAGIDIDTGVVHWTIACADPATGYYPEDPYAGFLPPNQPAIFYPDPNSPDPANPRMIHPGEGYLTYSVRPKADLATGTQVTNKATIVFDWNAPIDTPMVLNTIDALPPTSAVTALPAQTPHATFSVCWSGQDDPGGSGVATYTIYVSDNGGPYHAWLTTEDTCATFTDTKLNHTYRFYSVATDHVGNVEAPPTDAGGAIVPDAVTALPGLPGDANCDGAVNFDDINPFVLAVAGQAAYVAHFPGCNWLTADTNCDGAVNFDDINPFVACLSSGECYCPGLRRAGDLNCDGGVNFGDISPFVTALVGQAGYATRYPGCRWLNADTNGDGAVDFDDINPFVKCLVAGGCP